VLPRAVRYAESLTGEKIRLATNSYTQNPCQPRSTRCRRSACSVLHPQPELHGAGILVKTNTPIYLTYASPMHADDKIVKHERVSPTSRKLLPSAEHSFFNAV
jgi:hypothetical protein